MSGKRIKCWVCRTPLCQLEMTDNWYCPSCQKWLTIPSRKHYLKGRKRGYNNTLPTSITIPREKAGQE